VKTDRFTRTVHQIWDRIGDVLVAACCFLLSLVLYVQTLAPSVATLFDDSLEFPLVAHRLAIAHPTGYPLYVLLAKLFTLGPWQNAAWAVNLLSAVAGAVTVALVYLVARQLTHRRWPALLGAAALAVSPVLWSQAVIAEVYTLNAAFIAGLLWLALRWAQKPLVPVEPFSLLQTEPRRQRPLFLPREALWMRLPQTIRRLARRLHTYYRRFLPTVPPSRRQQLHPLAYVLAFTIGLSQTHHRTALLAVPALLIFAFLVERRVFSRAALLGPEHPQRPRWLQIAARPIVLLVCCFLLPLLFYLYLPLRAHVGSLDGTYAEIGFWRWVTASGYGAFLSDNPLARNLDATFYGELFWQQFGPMGLALALVGVIGLARRPKALTLTGLAFLTYVVFAVVYRVPDVEVFFIPALLILAVWIAVGLDWALDLVRVRGPSLALRRLLATCCLLLATSSVAQPLLIASRNYPNLDLSRRWIVHDYGQYVLSQDMPYGNSTVVGLGGEVNLLRTFQETTGLRRDVQTVIADDEAGRRGAVEAALAQGRAVYLTRPLPGLASDHTVDAVTGLVDVAGDLEMLLRVDAPAEQVPAMPPGVVLQQARGMRLLGAELQEHQEHWQAWARLRLWWRTPKGLSENLKVSARLEELGGRVIAAVDAEPVGGAYPTAAWRPGEVVADAYEIPLPPGTPPGAYTPVIVIYDPSTGAERGRIELFPVHLEGNPARPPRRALGESVVRTLSARFGDLDLLGFTPPDPEMIYRPGDGLPVTLLWQAPGQPAGELTLRFLLEGGGTHPLDAGGGGVVGGPFPANQWHAGQVVCQWPMPHVPDSVPAGEYHLKMRVTRGGQPVPWGRGLIPLGSDLDLGEVRVGRQG
jgi:hypothetical protein